MLFTITASAVLRFAGQAVWALNRLFDGAKPSKAQHQPPGLGHTTSACPWCHHTALRDVLDGAMGENTFESREGYTIPAEIIHRDGQIWMRKVCPVHGEIQDLLSSDAAFTARMESLYQPQDMSKEAPRGGRRTPDGLMLVVDLTNRCNMKCSPCFMDANRHAYVREATLDDVTRILERAQGTGSRRELDVLFSGGEPTISPIFLECVRTAKHLGFSRVQVATNGIRFAQEPAFARSAKQAGLYGVFLQLDGVSNAANAHRGVSNLFDVKTAALDRIHNAGLKTVLQMTVTNNLNNSEVGAVVEFAIKEIDRIQSVLFQPLVFTGRDELPTEEDRRGRRYTLSQLAHDLSAQVPFEWKPLRDWFPISASGAFGNLLDALELEGVPRSPAHDLHANHGQFSYLLVDTVTGQAKPLSAFFAMDRFVLDANAIASTRGRLRTRVLTVASVLRNLSPNRAPEGPTITGLWQLFQQLAGRLKNARARQSDSLSRWRFLAVNAVWFEDPFNVDFNVVCRSCAPVATPEGEFSFCAYNSMGWRQIIENRNRTADVTQWHRQHGRHPIYTNGAMVPLNSLSATGGRPATLASADEATTCMELNP